MTPGTCRFGTLAANCPQHYSQVLQQLYSLDPSSPDFLRVLYALIRNDDDEQYSSGLEGEELARLVDFLDNALCSVHPSDDVFRLCLRKLRHICGSHRILPSSYIISGNLSRIGESPAAHGGFADIWQGDQDGNRVCIKVPKIPQGDTIDSPKKSFFEEAVMWKRSRHPNIVHFLGVTIEPFQLVSEWIPNGVLTDYITKNPDANRIALLLDVAEGLNYLHANYMIHGDLKGPNILIKSDGHACLADFGLASIVHGNDSIIFTHVHGYSARWTAPEILEGAEKITRGADVFSFGMVVMETFTGRHPLSEMNAPSATIKTLVGERPVHPHGTEGLGFVAPVWNMTVDCWLHDPAHRPTMAAVVEFLRECYILQTVDPSLSTLPPWNPTLNVGGPSISGNSPFPTQELLVTQDSTSNPFPSGVSRALRSPLDDGSHTHSYPGESIPGARFLYRSSSPPKARMKKERNHSGKLAGRWHALVAVIRSKA